MLTRAQLAAIRAVLENRLGWEHPLTQAVHAAYEAAPREPPMHTDGDDTPDTVASTEREH